MHAQAQTHLHRHNSRLNRGDPDMESDKNSDRVSLGAQLTTQRSHRLVSLAVRSVMLAGEMSGGAGSVSIFLEG